MIQKLRDNFMDMVVYKDLRNTNCFSALGLPSFMRDWLLQHFEDEYGAFSQEKLTAYVQQYLPKREKWIDIKSRLITDFETVRLLAKIVVDINVKTGLVSFSLPDYGLSQSETLIEDDVWREYGGQLTNGHETWGMLELGYRPPDDQARPKIPGRIVLRSFKNFCPYETNLEAYKEASAAFTTDEWIDVLLGAIDYNAAGYQSELQKLTMLSRILPFAEKRLNLIELAPKGTGKSYLFGRVSRYGWLSNGGVMSRAKLFYDISRRQEGLLASHDFVTLDEVQSIEFPDPQEMGGALKGYLEQGTITVGNYSGSADAGMVLCGNIDERLMKSDGLANMFLSLPPIFGESALIDRFHGFIKGWNIPRMNDDLKVCGWALNSEYFCSILHELRTDASYRAIVDQTVIVPPRSDTRDTEAVKRIATAYLKLLFPHVRKADDITKLAFDRYCLRPAIAMRATIKMQMGIIDTEFRGKDVPLFTSDSGVFHA